MIFILFVRYAGVPVDFEEVQMDPKSESNEDLEYIITSIRRNGVAIKGNQLCVTLRLMYRVGQKQLDDLNLAPCRHLCR
jgi:hypothetical protein